MNRLSFLKTIGVGIAVAVITPKIIMERHRPIKQTGGVIPFLVKQGKGIDIEKPWYFDELA